MATVYSLYFASSTHRLAEKSQAFRALGSLLLLVATTRSQQGSPFRLAPTVSAAVARLSCGFVLRAWPDGPAHGVHRHAQHRGEGPDLGLYPVVTLE